MATSPTKVFWKSSQFSDDQIQEFNDNQSDSDKTEKSSSKEIESVAYKQLNLKEMSKSEMVQVIQSQQKEISYLQSKVLKLENLKDQMIDNFKLSSQVLLERLKDLEQFKNQAQQMSHLVNFKDINSFERPQTAQILGSIGASSQQPSTAYSNTKDSFQSSRGFGELGQTKRTVNNLKQALPNLDNSDDDEIKTSEEIKFVCPNCQIQLPVDQAGVHTVQCYKNSTKCKICGEVIAKDRKKIHLNQWRNLDALLKSIQEDQEELVNLHFDHGMDCNMVFESQQDKIEIFSKGNQKDCQKEWTPMHFAAKNGSLNVILALVSRGAGIDPTDQFQRTPLMVAIENNKTAVARSLIELGADVEITDFYGKTALMHACKQGTKEIVELLLKVKADVQKMTKVGDTAISLAQKQGNQDIVMMLIQRGASLRPQSRSRKL